MKKTSERRYWQIGAGDTNRNYASTLLNWDVMAMGPGYGGASPACFEKTDKQFEYLHSKRSLIERFQHDVDIDDVVVLRLGTGLVYGVGLVKSEYDWFDDFGDIDGWDLQHVRRVKWLWKPKVDENNVLQPEEFETYTMKFGQTIAELESEHLIKWIDDNVDFSKDNEPLKELPVSCVHEKCHEEPDLDLIGELLFDEGISTNTIDVLMQEISNLVRLAKWYRTTEQHPSESETVAFLAIPLLNALGWTPQRMSMEWNRVDIALFSRSRRKTENLISVVEAKKMDDSCLTAIGQARDYAQKHGSNLCKRLVVTDGVRYAVFLRDETERFADSPASYLNLSRIRYNYPILECPGARAALLMMAADWDGNVEFLNRLA